VSFVFSILTQPNIEQALQMLRQQVFVSGAYNHSWRLHIHEENEIPQTIEEVVKKSVPEGTHSILDIECVADDSHYSSLTALEMSHLQFLNASPSKPTRDVVEMFLADEDLWLPALRLIEANRDFQREKMKMNPAFDPHPFPRKVLLYFEKQRTMEELAETFVTQKEIWEPIHRYVCHMIEKQNLFLKKCKAIPFAKDVLWRCFGTEQPTTEQAKAVFEQQEIWLTMHRWIGYYTILYQDGIPHEIVFAGFSGD
jgi:hypothetical protein